MDGTAAEEERRQLDGEAFIEREEAKRTGIPVPNRPWPPDVAARIHEGFKRAAAREEAYYAEWTLDDIADGLEALVQYLKTPGPATAKWFAFESAIQEYHSHMDIWMFKVRPPKPNATPPPRP